MEPTAVLALTFPDDSVGRMQYHGKDTSDERLQAEIDKSALPAPPVSWRRCSLEDFPTRHADFRNAWKDDGATIGIDMAKARDITRHRLRTEREPILKSLDAAALRALEVGDDQRLRTVAAEKQVLRDITELPEIDAATTPDDLKAISLPTKAA
jgi:hypothetical protein